jgi:hypothetical protein
MAIATVRLTAWSDPTGPGFEVKFDPTAITAQPTDSGCVIEIQLDVTPGWQGHAFPCLLAVHGTLKLDASQDAGVEVPMQSLLPNNRTLRVPLSASDLAAVEQRRHGASQLTGYLWLAGVANVAFKPHHGYEGPTQAVVTAAVRDGGTPFQIELQQWLRLLKSAGFERVRMVELPVVAGAVGPKWAECMRLLERATGELRSDQSETAVGTCREVVEGIAIVLEQRWGVKVPPGKSMPDRLKELSGRIGTAWPDDKAAGEVLTALYSAVWSWTSAEHHYGSRVSRYDEAQFAIELTTSLLTHAGHLLEVHPEPLRAPIPSSTTDGSATPAASS